MTKRIFRSILIVSLLVFLVGVTFMTGILYQHFGQQLEKELQNELTYLSLAVENDGLSALESLPERSERVTLVGTDGTVLFDNHVDISTLDNHADREEIKAAMKNETGSAVRFSDTLGEKTVYLARRLSDGTVLRVSSTQYSLVTLLLNLFQPLIWIFILALALSGAFAYRASKKIVAPLNKLDLEHPDENRSYDELAPLLTKIKRQQKTIRRQLAEAKRQQEEFGLIMQHMNEGLLIIDTKMQLLFSNSSAYRLLGTDDRQAKSALELNRSEPFRLAVDGALSGKHEETILQLESGTCELVANPVLQDGEVKGAVMLLIDVTEKAQLESLRREFTANVSHELKTPLTSISGFAELMQDGLVRPEDVQKFSGRIFDEAQRLITLVGDVIKISQLDEGALPYEKEDVDLYLLAQEVTERLKQTAEKCRVRLQVEGESVVLHTTKPILDEVLYNLCDNAVKYNKKGGSVTVSVREEDDRIIVTVSDTGIGIPAADLPRIFERFYRVDKSHSKEIGGTGLGLSIVKHGAQYLGAQIKVESTVGTGTTFSLIWEK